MAKWKRRIKDILKKEELDNKEVWKLREALVKGLHGFDKISKKAFQNKVKEICQDNQLNNSDIKKISIFYWSDKNPDPNYLKLHIRIEGGFNGDIEISAGGGYRLITEGQEKIYYVSSYDSDVLSDFKKKYDKFNASLKDVAVEEIIKLAIEGKHIVEYDDSFKKYLIREYENNSLITKYPDIIEGYFDNDDLDYATVVRQLKKMREISPIKYAKETEMRGTDERVIYEWRQYELGGIQ